MGMTKRLWMADQELEAIAISALLAADVIRACDMHEDCLMESGGSGDLTEAYRLANARVTSGEIPLPEDFTRRDLTDKIKKMGEMYWPEICARCAKDD